jgi:ABC-type uncharacterized transport system involved in gliding motility auxiliary subunit
MSKQKKHLGAFFTSLGGVAVMALILIIVNLIFKPSNIRWDCTAEKLYTLSDGTVATLRKLEQPVSIRFYYSKDVAQMPVFMKTYAGRVEDLLKEYKRNGGKRIEISKLNPQPDSDAEDSAHLDGVVGQPMDALGMEDRVYLGIAISCAGRLATLPFLSPEREILLEYDITRALISVTNSNKPRIGVLSPMMVMGGIDDPNMMMQGQGGGMKPAWMIITELKKEYELVELPVSCEEIADNIDIVMAIHPKELEEQTLFALDQFVLRGGRLIAFLDPMCMADMQNQPQQMQYMPPAASSLDPLLKAWGISFETEKVVLDRSAATEIRQGQQSGVETMPNVLSIGVEHIDREDPTVSLLNSLLMLNAGAFSGSAAEGLDKQVLISTSDDSQLLEKFLAQRSGSDLMKDFRADLSNKELAIRLSGTFKSAYPEGKPGAAKEDDKDDEAEAAANGGWLKISSKPGAVVLVGDADMLYDPFCVRRSSIFGQTFVQPINQNLAFAQNMLESLGGDNALFSIRSRGGTSRPFTRVKAMELAANERYREQIAKLESEVQGIQREINDLQRKRQPGERDLLSAEQRQALAKFRKKEAEAKQSLKSVRKQLRQDIDALENNIMLANIALMPALVVIGGLGLAIIKRGRSKRQ